MVFCHIYSTDLFKTRYAFLLQETISIVTENLICIIDLFNIGKQLFFLI